MWFNYVCTAIIAIATAAIAGSIFFLREQVKSAEKARHADLIIRLSERWESPWLRQGREAIWKILKEEQNLQDTIEHYEQTDVKQMLKLTSVGDFFEDVGFLTKNEYIKPFSLIESHLGLAIEHYYDIYAQFIETNRAKEVYDQFEWLAKNIKKKT